MNRRTAVSITTFVVWFGVVAVAPGNAQPSTAPTWSGSVSQHHQMIYQMMKEMTQQLTAMTELMSRGELKPDERKQMAQRMALMSTIMRRLSGLAARPAINHAKLQEQVDAMRKQMDEMMRDSRMAPGVR